MNVLASVLGLEKEAIGEDASSDTLDAWDSLKQMAIVAAVEDEFGIMFDEEEIIHLNSVGSLREATRKALG